MNTENDRDLLPIGTLLRNGTYRVERYLGSGGFGKTYLVHHLGFDAKMVVKEFFMKGINMRDKGNTVTVNIPENRSTFESQRAKFKKEAQRLWKLKSDHIVGVYDIFEENGTVYYVMDFIDGESLEERLKRASAPLPEDEVTGILDQLLDALAVIHHNQPQPIFHLDIKPSNILLGRDGKVILIDFGASKQLSGTHEGVTSTLITYTKGYAPSEQMDGKVEHIGAWTDLYAVGATLYRLLTKNPSPEPSDIIIEGESAFLFPENVSVRIRSLIVWLMQPNRKKRPQAVEEVREWLENPKKPEPYAPSDNTTIYDQSKPKEPIKSTAAIVESPAPRPAARPSSEPTQSLPKPIIQDETTMVDSGHHSTIDTNPHLLSVQPQPTTLTPSSGSSQTFIANGVSFKMIHVEGGTFMMGATSEQVSVFDLFGVFADAMPTHHVTLSSYYIAETEVTQELWQAVMGRNPSHFRRSNHPVENVSWDDCQMFIRKLNSLTGKEFRLPTEAEWEYAARGGNKSQGYKYSGSNMLGDVAWYDDNSGNETHPVKTKSSNELGIYDMSGNVREWCADWYGSYNSSAQTNPTGATSGSHRVNRGGGWYSSAWYCRVAFRYRNTPDNRCYILGLRLAL